MPIPRIPELDSYNITEMFTIASGELGDYMPDGVGPDSDNSVRGISDGIRVADIIEAEPDLCCGEVFALLDGFEERMEPGAESTTYLLGVAAGLIEGFRKKTQQENSQEGESNV